MRQCLIVDSSRVIRRVASRILEDFAFETAEAEDGTSALEACRHKMPDLILLDGHLPNMSCIEFLRLVRREKNGAEPVVVYCTTENDPDEITSALGAGANEYILKPFDRDSLQSKLVEVGLLAGEHAGHVRV